MCAKEEERGEIITGKFIVHSFVANSVDFSQGRRENEGKGKRRRLGDEKRCGRKQPEEGGKIFMPPFMCTNLALSTFHNYGIV